MGKIKYLINRIIDMNYKQFFYTINQIHDKIKKNRIYIFLDIIYCGIKYQAGYSDYALFEMYNLNKEERKTIITRGINNELLKKYNDKSKIYIFEDKVVFNKLYNNYLNREWIYLDNNLEGFKLFIQNKKEIIVKPVSLSCGKGIEKIKVKNYNVKDLYNKLIKNNQLLIEEVAIQNKEISN